MVFFVENHENVSLFFLICPSLTFSYLTWNQDKSYNFWIFGIDTFIAKSPKKIFVGINIIFKRNVA